MTSYRGWKINGTTASKGGMKIFGYSFIDVIRRIDKYMDR